MEYQFEFSKESFTYLQQLALECAGIVLNERKQMLIYNRLVKRLRLLKLSGFDEYCELLKANDPVEQRIFIDAITTTVTAFFRENNQFEYLKNNLLSQNFVDKNDTQFLRIWSAGCSTGEEPYSIAIILNEVLTGQQNVSAEILATDLNLDALNLARNGIYPAESIAHIETERKKRCFLKGIGVNTEYVQVKPVIKKLITFKQLNLIGTWPSLPVFNIIFCRNVAIYFNKATQVILFNKFADLLEINGLLMVGHSESLYKISKRFKHLGDNIYRKIV